MKAMKAGYDTRPKSEMLLKYSAEDVMLNINGPK
jgi:hypothetical protein